MGITEPTHTPASVHASGVVRRRCIGLLASAVILTLAFAASAVPIVEWDLANATGQDAAVLNIDANANATAITASPGVSEWSSTAQDGFIAASGWATAVPDSARYYEWAVTAAAGYSIDYQNITLALFRGISGGNHGAEQWDLHASIDAFGLSDIALQTFDISSSAADEQILFSATDISALGTATGTVTFRLYGYDYTATGDFSGLGNDSGWLIGGTGANPVVGGSIFLTVPEPSTGLLVLLGLIVMGVHRRV